MSYWTVIHIKAIYLNIIEKKLNDLIILFPHSPEYSNDAASCWTRDLKHKRFLFGTWSDPDDNRLSFIIFFPVRMSSLQLSLQSASFLMRTWSSLTAIVPRPSPGTEFMTWGYDLMFQLWKKKNFPVHRKITYVNSLVLLFIGMYVFEESEHLGFIP